MRSRPTSRTTVFAILEALQTMADAAEEREQQRRIDTRRHMIAYDVRLPSTGGARLS